MLHLLLYHCLLRSVTLSSGELNVCGLWVQSSLVFYLCELSQAGVVLGHGLVGGQAVALHGVRGLGRAVARGHVRGCGRWQGPRVVHGLGLGASLARLKGGREVC